MRMRGAAGMSGCAGDLERELHCVDGVLQLCFRHSMARDGKQLKLTPVDDAAETRAPVIRLESKETLQRAKPLRLAVHPEETQVSRRLDLPAREDFEIRTHQPGIEALFETDTVAPETMEQAWGKPSVHHKNVPWGWFILLGLILAGGVTWSLTRVKKSGAQARQIRFETASVLGKDAHENQQASQLIDRINAATRAFCDAPSVDDLARLVRDPVRVRPLMDRYYADRPVSTNPLFANKQLHPLTLDHRANFWIATVELADHQTRNLIVEILDSGEARIDWETAVCYQPMKWDSFAKERPAGIFLDFRVYVELDNFFSHEFADSSHWNSFRLTARDSDETLFGYAKANEELARSILDLLSQNQGRRISVILRVTIPEGLQSRRGVVIEKLLSPRWLYIAPPDSSS